MNGESFKEDLMLWLCVKKTPRARFTAQGKLALEHNSIKAPMGGGNSACDLLTMHTLKKTGAAR